jgi:CPA2 family monovalent cation:H+ antiporter-2
MVLRKTKRCLNDETLLVISTGLCLGMALFADAVELSAALRAFMGSVFAETAESKRIEHLLKPLKDIFGSVFFVSHILSRRGKYRPLTFL